MEREAVCGCYTDAGRVKKIDQDAVFAERLGSGENALLLGGVFDGIGSMERSELASGRARDVFLQWFRELSIWFDPNTADEMLLVSQLRDVMDACNAAVLELTGETGTKNGCTATAAIVFRNRYHIVHSGDSRAYLYSGGKSARITSDDAVLTFRDGKQKLLLTNYLGRSEDLKTGYYTGTFGNDDMLFYGSDGFFHHLTEEDIALLYQKLQTGEEIEDACREAVYTVMERGETDNISLGVLLFCPGKKDAKVKREQNRRFFITRKEKRRKKGAKKGTGFQ